MMRSLIALGLVAAACSGGADSPSTVRLMTHDSFEMTDDLARFTERTGIQVQLITGGDAGEMLSRAIITKDNPVADVVFGIDNTFLGRALDEDIFDSYTPSAIDDLRPGLTEGTEGKVTPIDFANVCLNYDKAGLAEAGIEPPVRLEDLVAREYAGTLVVEDPSLSSTGLSFLLATIAQFGEGGWQDYWRGLRDNGVEVAAGWEQAYYGSFSGGSGTGERPIVVSYASSPPVEVIFAAEPITEAPTAAVLDGCFRQIEYVGIVSGTDVRSEAEGLIDFMLQKEVQEAIPLNMFVFPALESAALPTEFMEHTALPADPVTMSLGDIDANRDRWIAEWIDIVLR
ncbi:MAG: thiamine ABC transporter substrate-binding protein [Acidimicrobiia bacterium]|nr:thiamine ABC transporter substrate-binding protein [Acidimicrobiia bacterium]